MLNSYENITVKEFEFSKEKLVSELSSAADYFMTEIPCDDTLSAEALTQNGFYFADRYLDARIKLKNERISEFKRRFDIDILEPWNYENDHELENNCIDVFREAFTVDRRFFLGRHYCKDSADIIIKEYVKNAIYNGMPQILVSNNGQIAGSLFLKEIDNGYFIYLAGVRQRYKGTGAALEMYKFAKNYCINREAGVLSGRISASNTAVMNIYVSMGAMFYNPRDLYILEKNGH